MISLTREQAECVLKELRQLPYTCAIQDEAIDSMMAQLQVEKLKDDYYGATNRLPDGMVLKGNGWFHGKGLPPSGLPVADLKFAVYRDDLTQVEYQWHDSQWH